MNMTCNRKKSKTQSTGSSYRMIPKTHLIALQISHRWVVVINVEVKPNYLEYKDHNSDWKWVRIIH